MDNIRRPVIFSNPEESQSYMISVSDLMAGLLFVFIITLMVFALRLKNTEVDLDQKVKAKDIERQFLSVKVKEKEIERQRLSAKIDELTGSKLVRDKLLRKIKRDLEPRFRVEINLDQGILTLPEEILFPSGSAKLQIQGKEMLKVLSKVLYVILPCFTGTVKMDRPWNCIEYWHPGQVEAIFLEGHTDNIPIKSTSEFKDNWDLSAARAIETYDYLINQNPGLDEIKNHDEQSIFSVSGYAYKRPVISNNTEEGRRRNRRIDLRFIMTPPSVTPEVIQAIEKDFGKKIE